MKNRLLLVTALLAMMSAICTGCEKKPVTTGNDIAVTGVVLNETSRVLAVGATLTLEATVLPQDATNKEVSWESSDTAIATVADGVVTAIAEGTRRLPRRPDVVGGCPRAHQRDHRNTCRPDIQRQRLQLVMQPLNEYIAGRTGRVGHRELGRLIDKYEWFTTARRVRALSTGENDSALTLPLAFWATVAPVLQVEESSLAADSHTEIHETRYTTSEAIIDRFLEHGGYRITPSADTPDGAPSPDSAEEEHDLDPDLVTEELAEIYLAQGHIDRANEIYRRLSLRNP